MRTDLVIIGGGPAGMAAALSAHEQGVSLSRCAAEAINARCSTRWPEGYFELYGALADGSFVAPAELDYALDAPRKGW